ncbi:MAG: glutathione S-transferase family protein [Alphaproteobacteria bacterium]|nr:glutathione S-transferase family protein [Alphaproteobacteria bacterium]
MTTKIKLVTSKFSPYCHRVEMVLIEKNIPYEKQEIDLQHRPDWFVKDAPLGRVPMLYTDGKILFESITICEYLEEIFPEIPLHPKDPYAKAWHRGWMEFSNGVLAATFGMIWSQNQEQFDLKKAEVVAKLVILDKYLKFNPYFDGNKFSLVDICLASAFKPLTFVDNKFTLEIFDLYKNVATYAEGTITRGSLSKSLPSDYEEIFKLYLERKKSHLLTMSFSL